MVDRRHLFSTILVLLTTQCTFTKQATFIHLFIQFSMHIAVCIIYIKHLHAHTSQATDAPAAPKKRKEKKNPTCPQSSKLWEYFTQKPSNAVLCKDCRLELAYHTTTSDFWALEVKASQSTLSRLHQHKDSSGPVQHTALWLKWRNSHGHGSIGLCHISGLVWLLTVPKHRNEALPAAQLPLCCTTAAINIW